MKPLRTVSVVLHKHLVQVRCLIITAKGPPPPKWVFPIILPKTIHSTGAGTFIYTQGTKGLLSLIKVQVSLCWDMHRTSIHFTNSRGSNPYCLFQRRWLTYRMTSSYKTREGTTQHLLVPSHNFIWQVSKAQSCSYGICFFCRGAHFYFKLLCRFYCKSRQQLLKWIMKNKYSVKTHAKYKICGQLKISYLWFTEILVHAPFNKIFSSNSYFICFLTVNPDQLFSKFLWQKLGDLKKKTEGQNLKSSTAITLRMPFLKGIS